ncbi:MAG: hypothetical protein AAFQ19_02945 [Pseudomonadota bacterium]
MAELDRARANERLYERRAARARRSKWLGRLLFSLMGMGLLLGLRTHPEIVSDVIVWAHGTKPPASAQQRTIAPPSDIHVRVMPSDAVPVRRANTLPGTGTRPATTDAQGQADALGQALRGFTPGG